jgi:hypothetical protein
MLLPNLVEPGIRNYVTNSLKKCHDNRVVIYFWILNIGVVLFLIVISGLFVYYSLSKKLSPIEKRNKTIRDHEEVLKQIRVYREEQDRIHQFSGLPVTFAKRGETETPMRDIF